MARCEQQDEVTMAAHEPIVRIQQRLFLAGELYFNAVVLPAESAVLGETGPIDLQFFYTPDKVYGMVEAYGPEVRAQYARFALTGDIAYPIVYTLFFALAISWLFRRGLPEDSRLHRLNVVPFGAGLFDLLENLAIVGMLNDKFAAYPVTFTDVAPPLDEPPFGLYSKVYFNVGLSDAGDVDFQNTKKIDDASIHIPKLLEIAGLMAPFAPPDVVIASVNIAAHEMLHLLGTRHHDSYLPLGGGVPAPFVGAGYTPAFPGPAAAMLSGKEFNSLTGSLGFSAAKLGDRARVEAAIEELRKASTPGQPAELREQTEIMLHEMQALHLFAQGQRAEAFLEMDRATILQGRMPKPIGRPFPVKGADELYAELLLEAGRPQAAIEWFERTLRRTPNRSRAVIGLARAYRNAGNAAASRKAYAQFLQNWKNADPGLPELKEARAAVAR